MTGTRGSLHPLLLLLGPALFLLFFFYYPVASILQGGLTVEAGRFSLRRVADLLTQTYTLKIVAFTLEQALLSTLLALILGIPGAYILARYDFPGKGLFRALTTVPFVLPSIIVVLGFVRFFGNNGVLNRALMSIFHLEEPPLRVLYSLQAILLAHAFYNFPICIRIVSALWGRLNPHLEDAARSLGARGFRLFRKVIFPQILPGILASAALIFVYCLMSFAIVLVLGGGPQYTTIEVEVYRLAKVSLDLDTASALAIVASSLSVLFLYGYLHFQRSTSFAQSLQTQRKPLLPLLAKPGGILILLYLVVVGLVIIAPMLTVVATSFIKPSGWTAKGYSLEWYRRLLTEGWSLRAIGNSLFFGFMTALFSLPLGTLLAYITRRLAFSQVLETILMLPIGVSYIILGLGYLKAFQNLHWSRSWITIVCAHTVIAYPFVIRSVSTLMDKIKPSLIEAARSLGANHWQLFWKLELPLIKSAVVAGAVLAFGISVGEINATLMLYNPRLITMPVAIYRLISSYNFYGACALGSVLIAVTLLSFLIIDKWSGRDS